jgi:GTPase SAR1 family protein
MVIVGNKCDLRPEQRQVEKEDGRALANELGCAWTEASARFDENVAKAFDLVISEIEGAQDPTEGPKTSTCVVM